MAEQAPDPIVRQVNELLAGIVSGEGHQHERMTSDVVGQADEAADYVLHDAQLENNEEAGELTNAADPQSEAAAIIRRAVRNKTFGGLLGDILD